MSPDAAPPPPAAEDDALGPQFARAAAHIAQADALIVTAGAGLGVDSGLPDFRGPEGFWRAYPALETEGLRFQDIASGMAFEERPETAWGFYGHRLALYRATVPHAGFQILRRWMAERPLGGWVFTSNVDGQFQKAGFDAARVHECHGSIHALQCTTPCSDATWPASGFVPEVDEAACRLLNPAPRCPQCGALARPNILMFNDWGWVEGPQQEAAQREAAFLARVRRPVVVELGAGEAIPTVRRFGEKVARRRGGTLLRINPTAPQLPPGLGLGFRMTAVAALQRIDAALAAA